MNDENEKNQGNEDPLNNIPNISLKKHMSSPPPGLVLTRVFKTFF